MRITLAVQVIATGFLYYIPDMATAIGIATVIATSVGNAIDAHYLKMGTAEDIDTQGRRAGPLRWFLLHLVIWPVAYPWYMHRRFEYGVGSAGLLRLAVMIGFLAAWLVAYQ